MATPSGRESWPKTVSEQAKSLLHSLFKLPASDVLYEDFSCGLLEAGEDGKFVSKGSGRLFVTSSTLSFISEHESAPGVATKRVLPWKLVSKLVKHTYALITPGIAVSIESASGTSRSYVFKGFFGSSRADAFVLCSYLHKSWRPDLYDDDTDGDSVTADAGASSSHARSSPQKPSSSEGARETSAASAVAPSPPTPSRLVANAPERPSGAATPQPAEAATARPRSSTSQAPRDDDAVVETERIVAIGTPVVDGKVPLSVSRFWEVFLSDEASFGALDAARAAGYEAISVDSWQERAVLTPKPSTSAATGLASLPSMTRDVRFRKKLSGMLLSSTRVEQSQQLVRITQADGGLRILLRSSSRSLDVPYGDQFEVLEDMLVTPPALLDGDQAACRVRISARVSFAERGLLSGTIESAAMAGLQPAVHEWFQRVQEHARTIADDDRDGQLPPIPVHQKLHGTHGPRMAKADDLVEIASLGRNRFWWRIPEQDSRPVPVHRILERLDIAEFRVRVLLVALAVLVVLAAVVVELQVLPASVGPSCLESCGKELLGDLAQRILANGS